MEQALQTEAESAPTGHTCDRCGKSLDRSWSFAFKAKAPPGMSASPTAPREMTKCTHCALRHRPMLKRSMIAALLVGTVLTILNQGDSLLTGQWNSALVWKVPLTYCVPFLVATYGALTNSRK